MRSHTHSVHDNLMSQFNAEQIDLIYGLEPVFEPGLDRSQCNLSVWLEVCCPHCWQSYGSEFELALGPQDRIEDCPQCCGAIELRFSPEDRPGRFRLEIDRAG